MIYSMILAATLLATAPVHPHPQPVSSPTTAPEKSGAPTEKGADAGSKDAKKSTTRHTLNLPGKILAYTATAGEIPLTNDAGDTEARIFYTAYTLDTPTPTGSRPLLFIFNGGPGAASVWLHLGAIGPRRVQMLADGNLPPPPFKVIDNAYTWLDQADLVFVDPVGTGFSRAAKSDAQGFFTARGDIESMGKFLRQYLTLNERWKSPLFLVGESYGTFRCAGLSDYLLEHGIALNGIIFVSTVLNMQTISFDNGNDLPYQLFLPSYTATAWYHRKLAPDLQRDLDKTLAEAEAWSSGEYALALGKGDLLSAQERRETAEKLSRFTGLDPSFIERRNLRINSRIFARELLRDREQVVGYLDSRFVAPNVDPSATGGFDPSVAVIRPPFTSAFNSYVRDELKYETGLEYFVLGGGIGSWDWGAKNGYADTSDNLRNSMAKNPYQKVFVASGVFDLATPHAVSDYTMNHLGLNGDLRRNITFKRYRGGHMMYLERESLAQLKEDVAAFLRSATSARASR